MPRFNILNGAVAILRRNWYDDARTVFQDCSSGVCNIVLSDGTELAKHAANLVVGNSANFWAGWLERVEGVFDGDGRNWPGAGLGPMSPEGGYALKVQYFSFGPWDVIERDGSRWRLTDGDAADIQLLRNRRAIWTINGIVQSNFALLGRPTTGVSFPRACEDGTLLYQDTYRNVGTGALVLGGRVIAPSGNYFYTDVLLLNGVYHVCWSPNQADTDPQIMTLTPDQLAAMPPIEEYAPRPPKPPDPKPPDPTPIPPPVRQHYAAAKPYEGHMSEVTFYEHINYQGKSWKYSSDTPFVEDANDQFSSLKISGGSVTLFSDRDYAGKSQVVTSDVPDMRTIGWNDLVSSLKVSGSAETVRLRVQNKYLECNSGGTVSLSTTRTDNGKVKITRHDDGKYDVLFTAVKKQLSIQPDGSYQSRPEGTYGTFEALSAATQPSPAPADLLYRMADGVVITAVQIVGE